MGMKLVSAALMFGILAVAMMSVSKVGLAESYSDTYTFFIPRDNWRPGHQGFYIVGLADDTQYRIFDYTMGWTELGSGYVINQGELRTHMELPELHTYKVLSTAPVQLVMTSAEGSHIFPADYTSPQGLYRGQHFVALGNYRGLIGITGPGGSISMDWYPYYLVIFGLTDDTDVAVTLYTDSNDNLMFDAGDSAAYSSGQVSVGAGEHLTFPSSLAGDLQIGTTFWRVDADADVVVIRTQADGDEIDRAVSTDGAPTGREFYFANRQNIIEYGESFDAFPLGFQIRNMQTETARVEIYDVLDSANPILLDTIMVETGDLATWAPLAGQPRFSIDSFGLRYAKLVSDKVVSVLAGYMAVRGDSILTVPSVTGDGKSYVVNAVFGDRYDDPKGGTQEWPSYNELVGTGTAGSMITIYPSIPVGESTLEYFSAGSQNRVYYASDGASLEIALTPGGLNYFTFPTDAVLTGFYVETGGEIVWGGIGTRGATGISYTIWCGEGTMTSTDRWAFSSDQTFVFREGGRGNCWSEELLPRPSPYYYFTTVSSTTSITIIQSSSTVYSTLSALSTVGTSTSTSYATSTTSSGRSVTEYVTEFDIVYAYLLVIRQRLQEAVGGFVESVNMLSVLGPWLAVIGLVGCIGTVVVVAKKRRP